MKHLKCKLYSSASLAHEEPPFHPHVCIPVTVEGSDSGSHMAKMLSSNFLFPPESKRGSGNGHAELLWHRTRLMLSQMLKVKGGRTGGHIGSWISKSQQASFESLSQNTSAALKGAFDLQILTVKEKTWYLMSPAPAGKMM